MPRIFLTEGPRIFRKPSLIIPADTGFLPLHSTALSTSIISLNTYFYWGYFAPIKLQAP